MGIKEAFNLCIRRYRAQAAVRAVIHDDAARLDRVLSKGIPHDVLRKANIVWFAIDKPDCLRTLVNHKFDMGAAHDGKTPLALFLDDGAEPESMKAETAKLLLDAGANVNEKDRDGRSALQRVCITPFYRGSAVAQANTEAIAVLLVGRGADIDFRDAQGKTALHYAASRGQVALCKLLLDHGARERARQE